MNILVVDDCPTMCEIIRDSLVTDVPGAVVSLAYDGDEALRRIAELAPSLVVLNIVMPGKTGFDVLARVRADGNDVPILLTSGSAGEEVFRRNTLADERVRFLNKPFRLAEFTDMVRELLRAARPIPHRAKKPRVRTRKWTWR
jgi:DNA-binding response OmpR family regulator